MNILSFEIEVFPRYKPGLALIFSNRSNNVVILKNILAIAAILNSLLLCLGKKNSGHNNQPQQRKGNPEINPFHMFIPELPKYQHLKGLGQHSPDSVEEKEKSNTRPLP